MSYLCHQGCTIHYRVVGDGPNVVLLHGLGSAGADWEPQMKALTAHYRVLVIDLPGHGESQRWPDGRPYSIARFANDLTAVMDEAGMPSAHIVGFSMGGAVAFQLASACAEKVRSLVIVNSSPAFVFRGLARVVLWQRIALIRMLGMAALGKVLGKRLFPESPDLRETFLRSFRGNDKKSYLATMRALDGWDVRQDLARMACPTLIVASDRDYTPVSEKRELARTMPNATLEVIQDAGHALPIEQVDAFNASLLRCLSEFEKSAGAA